MIKVIKHGNTVHIYKCIKCGCIFIADEIETKIDDIGILLNCLEYGYYINDTDIIDDQEIIKDKLFEKVNVPSCWKVGEHDKKYEAINTSATTNNYIKSNETAKLLPDKCIKALDKWVDNLNEEKQENKQK